MGEALGAGGGEEGSSLEESLVTRECPPEPPRASSGPRREEVLLDILGRGTGAWDSVAPGEMAPCCLVGLVT